MHDATAASPRGRTMLIAALFLISLLAWAYIIGLSLRGPGMAMEAGAGMDGMVMPGLRTWHLGDLLFAYLMWAVMMVAMMTPTAAPMLLTYASLNRLRNPAPALVTMPAAFLAGYLTVWIASSGAATVIQWALLSAGLIIPELSRATPALGGVLLITAGLYQFTPWKEVCLSKCRTPLDFLMTEWRPRRTGAMVMGLRHGAYCLGCCWALMLLLFVAGVMNLLWVALIGAYVLVEKTIPGGQWISRPAGLVSLGLGAWLLVRAFVG